jgi:DNA uptake protein ComE-like DNA-binding protein
MWWAAVPVVSVGFLSFVPFLAYAITRGRKRDWAVFAAYLAATVAMFVAVGAINSNSGAGAGVGGFIIALAGCAAVHSAILFRPSPRASEGAPAAGPGPGAQGPGSHAGVSADKRNKEAVRAAQSRIERRKDARRLAQTDPTMARDLRIGRPDLPREYDDGGLVDVNQVPGATLASYLGLTPAEVTDVLAARDKIGRFVSADEVCAETSLSPDRVDELRDLMIFS